MVTNKTTRLALTAGMLALAAAAGCRGDRSANRPHQFFPDMDDSPKFKPQTQTPFFADGRAMRRPVEHTVAFGDLPHADDASRAEYLKDDAAYYFGTGPDGKYVATIPSSVTVDRKMLERGQERFNIYCSVCHGYDGKGKGMVGAQWQGVVANFHDSKFTDPSQVQSNDGYIFHTIRNGLPADDPKQPLRMPSYGYSVNEADAWAIVAYVRALQAQQTGALTDLPAEQRGALEASRAAEIEKVKKQRADEAAAAAKAAAKAPPPAPAGDKPAVPAGDKPANKPEVKP